MVFDDDIKVYKGEKSCGGERTADEIDRELADELAAQGRDELDEARAVGVELAQMTKEAERGGGAASGGRHRRRAAGRDRRGAGERNAEGK